MTSFLTRDRLEPARFAAEVGADECGAVLLFLGTVRSSLEDGDVEGIEYSAYVPMAEAEFGRIVEEARERWPEARIALRHRLGWIPTGEASIGIAVATPHRAEAYDCSRFLIEETKKRVPIWKNVKTALETR